MTELGGTGESEINTARCKFTARQAGQYKLSILLANQHIKGSPFIKNFLPGAIMFICRFANVYI